MKAFELLITAVSIALVLAPASAAKAWWQPSLADGNAQYQLGELFRVPDHLISGVKVYALDGWDTPASTVAWLVSQGAYPICYFSGGTYEDWRPDAPQFLPSDIGTAMGDWPGEWWLDIRSSNVRRIMQQRIAMCKSKGFLAVDPDNVDGYSNVNGKGLTAADQLDFNRFLAGEAHKQGVAVGLKNDNDQIAQLVDVFDFFVNEQCHEFDECGTYAPAKAAGKPVYNIEYLAKNFAKGCPQQAAMGIHTSLKNQKLKALPFTRCPNNPWLSLPPSPKPLPSPSSVPNLGPIATSSWWRPKASDNLGWQYMTSAEFIPATMWVSTAKVYVIDLFLNSAATTAAIAAKGGYAVCQFNAGTYEDGQPDSGLFTAADHPKNSWLDIRATNVRSIMQKRLELCKSKGFVAAVPEGLDAYINDNGMGLTAADQLSYNSFLADAAHKLGLAAGLMNDLGQVKQLLSSFDFYINESCMKYNECNIYSPAKLLNRPVWQVEYGITSSAYSSSFSAACKCQGTYGIKSIYKRTSLDAFRAECSSANSAGVCPKTSPRLPFCLFKWCIGPAPAAPLNSAAPKVQSSAGRRLS